ncbi:MAG: hypothetical protein JKY88_19465 [Pseudomonadales bacterium]|nr:hypothetical protein [Pseudomonadales bacterium]
MAQLTVYEEKALANIEEHEVWFSVSDVGNCRLSTLNKLVEKGYLDRIRRPGPYIPNESILFKKRASAALGEGASAALGKRASAAVN